MKNKDERKFSIGIFDSGFGGLQIMKHIVRELPEYNYIFLGDTARVPYGNRSQEIILEFVTKAVDFLFKQGCYLVILACNTASAKALRKIQIEYLPKKYPNRKVLGIIIPAVEEGIRLNKERIGVIATFGTVSSRTFEKELKKLNSELKVFQQACPLLVPIIEAGEEKSKMTDSMLEKYLKPLQKKKIDTLILGCTHYGCLENKVKKIMGKDVKIINEGKIMAKKIKEYLIRHPEVEKFIAKKSKRKFFSTDITQGFESRGSKFFGEKIITKKVSLE